MAAKKAGTAKAKPLFDLASWRDLTEQELAQGHVLMRTLPDGTRQVAGLRLVVNGYKQPLDGNMPGYVPDHTSGYAIVGWWMDHGRRPWREFLGRPFKSALEGMRKSLMRTLAEMTYVRMNRSVLAVRELEYGVALVAMGAWYEGKNPDEYIGAVEWLAGWYGPQVGRFLANRMSKMAGITDPCKDAWRTCEVGNAKQEREYNRIRAHGCCGFADEEFEFKRDGKTRRFKVGFNYGH